ncbi:peptidase M16 [Iodidimonas muriae]|uniref:Peptidase M16 n=1 Tax=Iodidimonas muriae TaxID=261467 RepID=A0ABQ2LCT5_9PROT|nr:pitrilysin family protein [Iodidimonas muriae]GER07283.1 peptidase M16 [Kordiimonadales bacterium JCM 17843]GGO11138.1 peptidase M16 [Iodidimonas muriae]
MHRYNGIIDTQSPLADGAQLTKLDNGIRIVTDYMPHVASVSLGLWVDAGARYETLEENGMSHLLEHMLFKGTLRRSPRAIAEEIENVGGHLNAYTSRDHTTFYAKVLKEDVPLAMDILADIFQNSVLDSKELDREREVIIQEIGQAEDTPDDIVFDDLQEVAYPDQPLGRSILGTAERVANFKRDDVFAFLKGHYRCDNTIVAAAGNITHEDVVRLVSESLSSLPTGMPRAYEPARYGGGEKRNNRKTEQLHMTLGFPSVSFSDPDYYASQVFSTMLGGGMSSRLFQEVREERGLAYSVYSFTNSHADTGLFGVYAGTSPDMAGDLVQVIAGEMLTMTNQAPVDEIARARAQLKAGLLMSLESTSSRIEHMARQLLIFGRLISIDEMVNAVDAVDGAALVRVCERLLSDGGLSVATVGISDRLPDYDRLQALFQAG